MKFSPAGNEECIGCFRFFHTESHVRFNFFHQTGADVAGCNKIAFSSRERTLIDMENHGQRRFIDMNGGERFRIGGIGYRFTDIDVFKSCHRHDIPHACFGDGSTFHSLPVEKLSYMIGTDFFSIRNSHGHSLLDRSPGHTADCHFAEIIIGFQRGHHDLQSSIRITFRSGNPFQNRIKQRLQILPFIIHMEFGDAAPGGRINQRKIKLLIISIKLDEKFKNFPFHIRHTLVRTVNLIDDDDRFQVMLKSFTENILRLGHRAFMGVNKEQDTVHHVQDTFYFPAKIGMPGRIYDIDLHTIMHDRRILRQDCNSPFPFQRVGIHDAFRHLLIFPENMALLQHGIHKSGFTMIDMGDDRNVADIFSDHFFPSSLRPSASIYKSTV